MTSTPTDEAAQRRSGSLYAIGAYGIWALLPLVFIPLAGLGAVEILSLRVIVSVLFCVVLLALVRQWSDLFRILRSRRTTGWLALAAVLVSVNWLLFIFATVTGRVLETSLAYFINPLMSILIGVIFLREKLRPLQWVALGFGTLAVIVITIGYGSPPVMSLAMATSFALYGLVKRHITNSPGFEPVPGLPGLTVETGVLAPVAIIALIIIGVRGELVFTQSNWVVPVMVAVSGIATAIPLVLFAEAAARLPLSWVGMFQYIAPVGQFLIGWALLGEPMPAARWAGFALVWVAVLLFIVDALSRRRR